MNTDAHDRHAATDCPNCGAAVCGNFCHQCGQETVLHMPSTREFMHEFIGHYVALEGKLWKSIGLLLFRPGRLTLEYIKGRRVRYVQPLRLYLTFSLIFFAAMKYGAHPLDFDAGSGSARPAATAAARTAAAGKAASVPAAAPHAPAPTAEVIHEDRPGEVREGTHKLREVVGNFNPHWADRLAQFSDMSREERNTLISDAFYHEAPYAVFFMMPLFALYLKVLYLGSGRRYGEHLLFALHANGFAFLAMTLMMLVPDRLHLWPLTTVLWLWLVFYLPAAMRRVYGGSRLATGLRWSVLMLLHLVTLFAAVCAAVAFGVLH